jgi:hypothetical protein
MNLIVLKMNLLCNWLCAVFKWMWYNDLSKCYDVIVMDENKYKYKLHLFLTQFISTLSMVSPSKNHIPAAANFLFLQQDFPPIS